MSKNYAILIHFMLPLTTFYRSGAHRSDVYKWDAFVTSWRFYNRAWQPQRHDRLPETSGTLWIHRGALTNQRCSLATGCGINGKITSGFISPCWDCLPCHIGKALPVLWCLANWPRMVAVSLWGHGTWQYEDHLSRCGIVYEKDDNSIYFIIIIL